MSNNKLTESLTERKNAIVTNAQNAIINQATNILLGIQGKISKKAWAKLLKMAVPKEKQWQTEKQWQHWSYLHLQSA